MLYLFILLSLYEIMTPYTHTEVYFMFTTMRGKASMLNLFFILNIFIGIFIFQYLSNYLDL